MHGLVVVNNVIIHVHDSHSFKEPYLRPTVEYMGAEFKALQTCEITMSYYSTALTPHRLASIY